MQEISKPNDLSVLKRFVSIETLLSVVAMLTGLGVTWGSLSTRMAQLDARIVEQSAAIKQLEGRDITPGAREQVAVLTRTDEALHSADVAMNAQLAELREEMRLQRREILDTLQRLEARLEVKR